MIDIDFIKQLYQQLELPLKNPVLIFSLILFIILLSPIVLRRLKIPGIIGLIISGVIIGPHGLNLLAKNAAVDLFSTIGLLYIMFIAGIELDMNEFRKNRYKSIGFGFFTFAIPLLIGFPTCHYLLGYDFTASLLTASMFATHTLVAYPIVNKFGITKNQAVAIAVGGTILTDTAVLLILAVIIGADSGGLNNQFWIRLGVSLAIFSFIMFFVMPRVARWFFTRLAGDKTSHYVFVLSLVFLAAFLAEVAGVEPIIGAFVAGLALNRSIPHSSALMNRLEFVGNAIFIPFFLISVGMVVDMSVLLKGPTAIIVALVLSVAALFGKWLAAFVTQKLFRYTTTQRQLIFGLSTAHAAATLAVILVGYKAHIIDENILNGTIILILITCVVASFATENAAKKMVEAGDQKDREELRLPVQKESILIPVTDYNSLEALLDLTILIRDKKTPSPVNVVTVVNNDDKAEMNLRVAKRRMDDFVRYAAATETRISPQVAIDFNVSNGIVRTAKEVLAGTIIMGWIETESFLDKIFGQKTETIINTTDKAIILCNLKRPLNTSRGIKVFCPPLAELEIGFDYWLNKIQLLSGELSQKVQFYCNEKTKNAITKLNAGKGKLKGNFVDFAGPDDFDEAVKSFVPEDLIVIISTRKGSVSHQSKWEQILKKTDVLLASNNVLLIYPSVKSAENKYDEYSDVNSDLITKSVETVNKLQKGIGNMFGKKEEKG